ncbi:MAG: oligosaccharide flippase family protein [Candidatus Zixiibacteriota bacterium]
MFHILKNLAKHSAIYGAADMLSRAIGFVMIPLYTHYLTTSDYGTLELLDLTSYVVAMFLGLGISQAVVRYYFKYENEAMKQQVLSVAIITLTAISMVMLAVLLLVSDNISQFVFDSTGFSQMLNIVFITFVIQLGHEVPKVMLRVEEKSVLFVTISLARTVLSLVLNIYFIVSLGMGVMGILVSGLIANSLAGIVFTYYIFKRIKFSYSFPLAIELLKFGIPLVWSTFGMFILNFGDRFILQRVMSLSEVGIYALAYKFGMMPNILVLAPFFMIWAPKRFEIAKEPNANSIFATVFTYFMFIELFISLGIAVLIKDVIQIIADASYADSYKYVGVLLVAYVLCGVYQYVQFGIHVENKTKYLAYATLSAAGINIGLNLLLIPRIGIWGAALSTLIAFLALTAYTYWKSQPLYYIPYETSRLVKLIAVAFALYGIALWIDTPNVALSLITKFLVACCYPLVLYVLKFYTDDELRKAREILQRFLRPLKSKTS